MRRVEVVGPRRVEVREAPEPEPGEGEALVRVLAAAICAEHRPFAAGEPRAQLGHEAVGELVETGERVVVMPLHACGACEHCTGGAYVHCAHAFDRPETSLAQYVAKPRLLLPPLPDDVPPERGVLACCALGPGFGALEKLRPADGATVLVTGAGPVGLGTIANARFRGLEVLVVEPSPERRALAERLGATAVESPGGVDCAIECSGTVAGARLCIDATRRLGGVAFVGVGANEPVPLDRWGDLIEKGLTLHGAWHYNLHDVDRVLEVARSPLAAELVARVFGFSEAQRAFELAAAGTAAKVVLDPWA